MRVYMDEHVNRAMTIELRQRGIDVLTAQEDGFAAHPDPEVLDRAGACGCILYTEDRHFLIEATRRQRLGQEFAGVVYCHQLRISVGQRIRDLEVIATCGDPADFASRVTYLPIP